MLKKISEQMYHLKAGQYFDVHFKNRYFRVNAVNILRSNGVLYNTLVITFDDDMNIVSKPTDTTKELVKAFLNKVKSLTSYTEKDISYVCDIEKYESNI